MDSNGTVHQVKSVINMGCFNLFQQLKGFQGAMIKVMKCVQNIPSQIMDVEMCISFFLVLLKPNIAIILLFIYIIYIAKRSNSWKDVLLNISWQEKGWNDVWWAKKIKPIVLRRCAFFSVWLSIFVYYLCDLHCRSVCLHRCVCVCLSCVSVFLLVFAHIPARGR